MLSNTHASSPLGWCAGSAHGADGRARCPASRLAPQSHWLALTCPCDRHVSGAVRSMPLARAFGVKAKAVLPPPGRHRSLWQVFSGTSGDLEPEAARFIVKETGRDPVTGEYVQRRQNSVSIDMGGTKSAVRAAQCSLLSVPPSPPLLPPSCVCARVCVSRKCVVAHVCRARRRRGRMNQRHSARCC